MTPAVLALGSNQASLAGDPLATLQAAVDQLAATPGIRVRAVSPVFRTDPVGYADQDDFLNLVLLADTDLPPLDLLAAAQQVEQALHRVRTVPNGPRTIDVDVVTYGAPDDPVLSDDPRLVLPHPRAHERGFVLVPWLAADPDGVLPGHGRVADLAAGVDVSGVHPTDLEVQL